VTFDVGVESTVGSKTCMGIGVVSATVSTDNYLGACSDGLAWHSNNKAYCAGDVGLPWLGSTSKWSANDVVSCEMDFPRDGAAQAPPTLHFSLNGLVAGSAPLKKPCPGGLLPALSLHYKGESLRLLGLRGGFHHKRFGGSSYQALADWRKHWLRFAGWWREGQMHGPGVLFVSAGGAPPSLPARAAPPAPLPAHATASTEVARAVLASQAALGAPEKYRDNLVGRDDAREAAPAGFFAGAWAEGEPVGAHRWYALPPGATVALALSALPAAVRAHLRLAEALAGETVAPAALPVPWGAAGPAGCAPPAAAREPPPEPLRAFVGADWEALAVAGPWLMARGGLDACPGPAPLPPAEVEALAAAARAGAAADATARAARREARAQDAAHLERVSGAWAASGEVPFVWCPAGGGGGGARTYAEFKEGLATVKFRASGATEAVVGSVGFSAGKHTWEVKITESSLGLNDGFGGSGVNWISEKCVFFGVSDLPPRLRDGAASCFSGMPPAPAFFAGLAVAPDGRVYEVAERGGGGGGGGGRDGRGDGGGRGGGDGGGSFPWDSTYGLFNNRQRTSTGGETVPDMDTKMFKMGPGLSVYVCLDMDAGTLTFTPQVIGGFDTKGAPYDYVLPMNLGTMYNQLRTGGDRGAPSGRALYPWMGVHALMAQGSSSRTVTMSVRGGKWMSEVTAAAPAQLEAALRAAVLLRALGDGAAHGAPLAPALLAAAPSLLAAACAQYRSHARWAAGTEVVTLRARGGVAVTLERSNAALRRTLAGAGFSPAAGCAPAVAAAFLLRAGDVLQLPLVLYKSEPSTWRRLTLAGVSSGFVWAFDPWAFTPAAGDAGDPAASKFGGGPEGLWYMTPAEFVALLGLTKEALSHPDEPPCRWTWAPAPRSRAVAAAAAAEAAAEAAAAAAADGAAGAGAASDEDVRRWALDPAAGLPGVPRGEGAPPSPWTIRDDIFLVRLADLQCLARDETLDTLVLGHDSQDRLDAMAAAASGSGSDVEEQAAAFSSAQREVAAFAWALPGGLPLERLRARFALLLAYNRQLELLLPLVDLALRRERGLLTMERGSLTFFSRLAAPLARTRALLFPAVKRALLRSVAAALGEPTVLPSIEVRVPKLDSIERHKLRGAVDAGQPLTRREALLLSMLGQVGAKAREAGVTARTLSRTLVPNQTIEAGADDYQVQPDYPFAVSFKDERGQGGGLVVSLLANAVAGEELARAQVGLLEPSAETRARAAHARYVFASEALPGDEVSGAARASAAPAAAAPAAERRRGVADPFMLAANRVLGVLVGASLRFEITAQLALEDAVWRALAGLPLRASDLGSYERGLAEALAAVEGVPPARGVEALRAAAGAAVERLGGRAPHMAERAAALITFSTRPLFLRFYRAACVRGGLSAAHMAAFFDGLKLLVPTDLFALFSPRELRALFEGRLELSWAVLRETLTFTGEPWPAELRAALEASLEATTNELRVKFFCFITGRRGVGGGAARLELKLLDKAADKLPIAHMCYNRLDVFAHMRRFEPDKSTAEQRAAAAARAVQLVWTAVETAGPEVDIA